MWPPHGHIRGGKCGAESLFTAAAFAPRGSQALAKYDEVLEIEPAQVDGLMNRGHALQKLRRFEEAADSCAPPLSS